MTSINIWYIIMYHEVYHAIVIKLSKESDNQIAIDAAFSASILLMAYNYHAQIKIVTSFYKRVVMGSTVIEITVALVYH